MRLYIVFFYISLMHLMFFFVLELPRLVAATGRIRDGKIYCTCLWSGIRRPEPNLSISQMFFYYSIKFLCHGIFIKRWSCTKWTVSYSHLCRKSVVPQQTVYYEVNTPILLGNLAEWILCFTFLLCLLNNIRFWWEQSGGTESPVRYALRFSTSYKA